MVLCRIISAHLTYSTILLDFDHTLFDSDASEAAAFESSAREVGIDPSDGLYTAYQTINKSLWRKVEEGVMEVERVAVARFDLLVRDQDLDADPVVWSESFRMAMGASGELYPGVIEVLEQLSEMAVLALVTNGIGQIQRARVDRLGISRYFDAIVISGEVGASKPGSDIYRIVFDRLGNPSKETALMVGDSLSSDILGGSTFGIDTCWYDTNGSDPDDPGIVTHQIADLSELITVTLNGRSPSGVDG